MRPRLALLALLAACRAPVPPPPCQASSLAGLWHDAEDPAYRYRVEDRGATVLAHPFLGDEDTGIPGASVVIELRRATSELAGVVRQAGPFVFPDGSSRDCTVEFAARVVACPRGRLELEVLQSHELRPDCTLVPDAAPDAALHEWVREP